jgi:hypothetical protein
MDMVTRSIAATLFRFPSRRPLVTTVLGAGLLIAAVNAIDCALNPWAHSWSGQRQLVGYWQGDIVFEPGDTRQVVLSLTRDLWDLDGTRSQASTFNVEGRARICGPGGDVRYTIQGVTHDRQGARFTLGFGADRLVAGRHLNAIRGTWASDDRLTFRTSLYTMGTDGVGRGVASADAQVAPGDRTPQVVFELRRTSRDVFDAACSARTGR